MTGALDIHPKVVASSLGGIIALALFWLLAALKVHVTWEECGSASAFLVFAFGWLAPSYEKKTEQLVAEAVHVLATGDLPLPPPMDVTLTASPTVPIAS